MSFLKDLALGIWHLITHLFDGVKHRIKTGSW